MDEIRIKNLRTLSDTGYIELKKINVLLGRNSSGKSTFARVFPLLKQGGKIKSKSGVLWYGSDVDFGSFQDAKSRHATKSENISFTFVKKNLNVARAHLHSQSKYSPRSKSYNKFRRVEITANIFEDEKKRATYELKIGACVASFNVIGPLGSRFTISGVDLTDAAQKVMYFYRHSGLLPDIYPEDKPDLKSVSNIVYNTLIEAFSIDSQRFPIDLIEELHTDIFYSRALIARSLNIDAKELSRNLVSFLRAYTMWREFPLVWETVRDLLTASISHVRYTRPLRASAERYYRTQGLSVEEIDPQGTNLAMFLNDLSPRAAAQFSSWTKKNLGFSIESKTTEGHVSILVSDSANSKTNMADTGFGFSQVAPILAQVWQCMKSKNNPAPFVFVIEQPELHLHPHMQSKLASLFSLVADENPHIKFIIETHSEVFINQFGDAVDKDVISASDIGIYIFEKNSDSEKTLISQSYFDKDGFLEQWPYGFFDA